MPSVDEKLDHISRALSLVLLLEVLTMSEIDDLKANEAALKAAVEVAIADIASLKTRGDDVSAKLAALSAQPAISPADVAAVAADAKTLADSLTAAHASLSAAPAAPAAAAPAPA